MFIHYRTQGFILKKENLGEADQLFTIYTKDFGKIEVLGRGIRKITSKLRPGAEIFYLSEIEFIQGKIYKTLTDVFLIEKFENLRKNLMGLVLSYRISEVLNNLVKGQEPDEKIWQFLIEIFRELNNSANRLSIVKYQILYYYFLWNLLSILGYRPELYHCVICQKKLVPEKLYFSVREGGVVCNRCQNLLKTRNSLKEIEVETLKLLRILVKKDWSISKRLKIEAKNLNSLKTISNYFLSEVAPHLNCQIKKRNKIRYIIKKAQIHQGFP